MKLTKARVNHWGPAVIPELEWSPERSLDSWPETDPIKEVLFSFTGVISFGGSSIVLG
jgi:hypothetical protein